MLDVHEQQLLVLLLVMAAQFQQFETTLVDPARLEGVDDRLVDAGAEVPDLRHRRAGDEPALRPRLPWADRLVVRVEQEAEHRLRRGVAGQPAQHELLEEPRGVCPVPRRGAGRGHRLGDLVLGAEPGREQVGEPPDLLEPLDHALGAVGGGDGSGCHGFPRGLWSTAGGPRRRTPRPPTLTATLTTVWPPSHRSGHAGQATVAPTGTGEVRAFLRARRRCCVARARAAATGTRGSCPCRHRRGSPGGRG